MNAADLSSLRAAAGLIWRQYRMRAEVEPPARTEGLVKAYNIIDEIIRKELTAYDGQFPC